MMQSRLFLLVAAAACFRGGAVMSGFTANSPAGQWVPTSTQKGCESNGEGIKPIAKRGNVNNAESCRNICERSGSCMAVDFYTRSGVCLLYDDACETPQSTADGATSYRLVRTSTWTYIDSGKACETNEEGILPLASQQAVQSLEECQQACSRRGKCRAVDYYKSSGYCIFYSQPCVKPLSAHDGSSSFKVAHQVGAQTVADMKHHANAIAADQGLWEVIDSGKSCEGNDENISPLQGVGGSLSENSVMACQRLCIQHPVCQAIDYYRQTDYCVLYAQPCSRPSANHNGAMSQKLKAAPLNWQPIDKRQGCESNKDGIKRLDSGRSEPSLQACQHTCEGRLDCAAVDYYQATKWCNFYNEACTKPMSTADQVGSYRIVRTKQEDQKTTAMRGSGMSVAKESSSSSWFSW